jgi:MFS transporter, PPP family, 3-phenylpropionic acid transporter
MQKTKGDRSGRCTGPRVAGRTTLAPAAFADLVRSPRSGDVTSSEDPQATEPPVVSDGFAVRLAVFYAGLFVVVGIQVPYFPVWLQAKGLDSRAIGIMLAVPVVARVIAVPLVTRLVDRRAALRPALVVVSLVSVIGSLAMGRAQGFAAIFATMALVSVVVTPAGPLADAYALKGLGLRKRSYGPVRLWGSVAYIAANIGGGLLLSVIAPVNIIWLIVGAFVMMSAASLVLAPVGVASVPGAQAASPAGRPYRLTGFLTVAIAASLIQGSHAVYYAFSTLDWTAEGLGGAVIGALWALGVAAEVALFAVSAWLPPWIGPTTLLTFGALGAILRWAGMAFGPPVALLVVLQCLHGLSFAATHLGSVQWVARVAPDHHAATAQGDFATILGLVMTIALGGAGLLYGAYGDRAYLAMAVLAAAGGSVMVLMTLRPRLKPPLTSA